MLKEKLYPERHVGPYFLWPRFGPEGHPLLEFYRAMGVADLAAQLLRADLTLSEPAFAQVATIIRFVSMPLSTMTGYLLSCLTVTHDFSGSKMCVYGAVGLPGGLIAARRRYNQDQAARRVGQ